MLTGSGMDDPRAQAKSADINRMRPGNGGPSASLTEAVRRTSLPLDDLQKNIVNATSRIRAATEYAKGVADALFGHQPEPENTRGSQVPEQPRESKLDSLNEQIGWTHSSIADLEHQLNRFEPLRG